ncbi:MAG TPA: hypothetical protein VJT74_07340, partial [Pyrinomonadaceae bacterium]|nr:hypothetical protein [Pyrinomonadaceae bacterium]
MKTSLSEEATREISGRLHEANSDFAKKYPGESGRRQPVHTVYGGAHLFKSDSARRLGELARRSLEQFAPDSLTFARAIGLPGSETLPDALDESSEIAARLYVTPDSVRGENKALWLAHTIYHRVVDKLRREAVEDFRIDFEDGYGNRPDQEEDGHAEVAAREVATGVKEKTLPPFIGIRIKPLTEELRTRSLRTLDIFISTLCAETGNRLPENFVVTLPKVVMPEQVAALADVFDLLEREIGLASGSLKMELMI